jgi:hypothetical protein
MQKVVKQHTQTCQSTKGVYENVSLLLAIQHFGPAENGLSVCDNIKALQTDADAAQKTPNFILARSRLQPAAAALPNGRRPPWAHIRRNA